MTQKHVEVLRRFLRMVEEQLYGLNKETKLYLKSLGPYKRTKIKGDMKVPGSATIFTLRGLVRKGGANAIVTT